MALRSYDKYEVKGALPEIGWRCSKQYFLVKDASDPKVEKILFWLQPGIDFCLDHRSLSHLQRSLAQMQVCCCN